VRIALANGFGVDTGTGKFALRSVSVNRNPQSETAVASRRSVHATPVAFNRRASAATNDAAVNSRRRPTLVSFTALSLANFATWLLERPPEMQGRDLGAPGALKVRATILSSRIERA